MVDLMEAVQTQSCVRQWCPSFPRSLAQACLSSCRQLQSRNVHFQASKTQTQLLWAVLCLIVLLDLALTVTAFASFVCVSRGHDCDLTAVVVILCVYPMAIFAGPGTGLVAVSVGGPAAVSSPNSDTLM
jgi:hypothetical protein